MPEQRSKARAPLFTALPAALVVAVLTLVATGPSRAAAGSVKVVRVGDGGALEVAATTPTAPGARVVVADAEGTAYVIDPRAGRILALPTHAR